jgi:hypothetical protein
MSGKKIGLVVASLLVILVVESFLPITRAITPNLVAFSSLPQVESSSPYLGSVFSSCEPSIDGVLSSGEWESSAKLMLEHGWMQVQNDAANLYILIDVTGDTTNDPPKEGPPWGDFIYLSFEVEADQKITSGVDVNFGVNPVTHLIEKRFILSSVSLSNPTVTYSKLGMGFGTSDNSGVAHRIWEFAISLNELNISYGGNVRMGLRVYSQNPYFMDDVPDDYLDFSNLIDVKLATLKIDLLIIGHEDFLSDLKPLKVHKDRTGIKTYIQSWQILNRSFSSKGVDEPERIKRAIAYYEANCGVRYVMLVGDIDKFPTRYRWWGLRFPDSTQEGWAVSDLYYADIYKSGTKNFDNWDANSNGLYGEEEFIPDGTINNDNIDYLPDVAVGRIPASTSAEVVAYVNKVINYETKTSPNDAWFKRMALYTGSWDPGRDSNVSDNIGISMANKGFSLIKRYWDSNGAPPGVPKVIINDLNSGVGFVSYSGHGNSESWELLSSGDLFGLTNADMLPIVFASCCETGMFARLAPFHPYKDINGLGHPGSDSVFGNYTIDYGPYPHSNVPKPAPIQDGKVTWETRTEIYDLHCLAESFLFGMPVGSTGAIAYIGARTGAQVNAIELDTYFYEAYSQAGVKVLGDM